MELPLRPRAAEPDVVAAVVVPDGNLIVDFAEAEYIVKLRNWLKGHFSYRAIAWEMKS